MIVWVLVREKNFQQLSSPQATPIKGVGFLPSHIFIVYGELITTVNLESDEVSTWKSYFDTQVSIWSRLKRHSFLSLEWTMLFGSQRPLYLINRSLFIDGEWYGFKVFLWTLNLMTCVICHFYTRGCEFDHRKLFHTCIFPYRYELWVWFS